MIPENNPNLFSELDEKCKEIALSIELEFIGLNYAEIENICIALLKEAKNKSQFTYTAYKDLPDNQCSFSSVSAT